MHIRVAARGRFVVLSAPSSLRGGSPSLKEFRVQNILLRGLTRAAQATVEIALLVHVGPEFAA